MPASLISNMSVGSSSPSPRTTMPAALSLNRGFNIRVDQVPIHPHRPPLSLHHLEIQPAIAHELLVPAGFDNSSAVDDDDQIGVGDRAEAMSDHESRAALK